MNRIVGLVAVTALGCVLAGCGGDPEESPRRTASSSAAPDPDGTVLRLSEGSTLEVPAPGATGVVSEKTPVELEFRSIECKDRLPGIGYRRNKVVDLVAGQGNQLCLVSTAVTNAGKKPNFFSSREVSKLRASGKKYAITKKTINYQAIADAAGQQLASTSDLMDPGETKYDYAVYEIPAAAEPDVVVYAVAP